MLKLPRLSTLTAMVDTATGRATLAFSRLWDLAMTKIENQFSISGSGTGIVVATGSTAGITRSLAAGVGLNVTDANGVAGNPTYSLANTAVSAGTYGDGTHVSAYTVDAQGRLISASDVAITYPVTSVFGRTGAVVAAANDYSFSQLSGKPTTLAGYGITDAVSSSLTSAKIIVGNGSNIAAAVSVSGDASISNAGALTVTKTSGTSFAASATTDTTNASNISSGVLGSSRGGAGAVSGILKANGSGVVSAASSGTDYAPATSGSSILYGNGSGGFSAVTVGSGLGFSTGTLTANVTSVFGRTGAVVAATSDYSFSQISGTVGASQLPNPSASTLGGIQSAASQSHKWINSISTSGIPSLTQPASTDLSDYATGTWTPADASGAGLTFSSVSCAYTKIGNMVFCYGTLTFPSTASAATPQFSGLPFSAANAAYGNAPSALRTNSSTDNLLVMPLANTTQLAVLGESANESPTNSQLSGALLRFNFSYPVS